MKHLSGALALLLSACIFAFGQAEQPKQQDTPTLDETVKWLTQELPALAAYEGKSNGNTVTLGVVSATFDGSSCTLSTQMDMTLAGGVRTNDSVTYVFSLASLDPEKILVERLTADTNPPKYDLMINAKDEKKAIKRTASVRYGRSVHRNYADMTSRLTLSFDSGETAHRFEKAFKHAAKLSQGSSKEPF